MKKLSNTSIAKLLAAGLVGAFIAQAQAGPVIIDGTDANDHGSVSGGINQAGWLYMQKALENLAGAVTTTASMTVVDIGTTSGQARNAINSAFGLSTLPGLGWSLTHVDGAAAITTHLAGISTSNTGILYIPTRALTGGDLDTAELAAINANAAAINTFVGGTGNPALGGGLFAMGEEGTGAFGWLTTLIPGIVANVGGAGTNITLTAAGMAAFPGLTDLNLSGADPWHDHFTGDFGGLQVLGTAPLSGVARNVILGGGAGTVIACGLPGQPACPTVVPEPGILFLFALGLLGLMRRRIN